MPGRKAAGWSQAYLAQRADCSQSAISQIEAGDLNVTVELLARIASALGVEVTDLFAGDRNEMIAAMILRWRRLSPAHRLAVLAMAESLAPAQAPATE